MRLHLNSKSPSGIIYKRTATTLRYTPAALSRFQFFLQQERTAELLVRSILQNFYVEDPGLEKNSFLRTVQPLLVACIASNIVGKHLRTDRTLFVR